MSANAVALPERVEVRYESLVERMDRGGLSLAEVLGYATQIAAGLRDLHTQRLVYGAVSSQLIVIGASGATLKSSGGLRRLGDGRRDVAAFGAVLAEMVCRVDGPEDLCAELIAIAARCQNDACDMRRVLISLRLLGLRLSTAAARRPVSTQRTVTRNRAAAKPGFADRIRLRFHMSLHWQPLANLAAFGHSSK
jgi:hypothetical protein